MHFTDINECLLGASNCRGGERCINTEGSFRCQREVSCGTGYELTDNNNCKGRLSSLTVRQSHVCFLGVDVGNFFLWFLYPDIDECETGIHNCGPEFQCQNTQGSFRCLPKVRCGAGFIQDALGNCIGKLTALNNKSRKSDMYFSWLVSGSARGFAWRYTHWCRVRHVDS